MKLDNKRLRAILAQQNKAKAKAKEAKAKEEEAKAKAKAEAKAKEEERKREEKFLLILKVNEKAGFAGDWSGKSFIRGPAWFGSDYYSHAEGRHADCFFLPAGQVFEFNVNHRGCPWSFTTGYLKRIK